MILQSCWAMGVVITFVSHKYCAWTLAVLMHQFIDDHTFLPMNPYGAWNQSMLVNKDLANDLNLYLQEIGEDVTAKKLAEYLVHPEVKEKHGITRTISEKMAHDTWMSLDTNTELLKKACMLMVMSVQMLCGTMTIIFASVESTWGMNGELAKREWKRTQSRWENCHTLV